MEDRVKNMFLAIPEIKAILSETVERVVQWPMHPQAAKFFYDRQKPMRKKLRRLVRA